MPTHARFLTWERGCSTAAFWVKRFPVFLYSCKHQPAVRSAYLPSCDSIIDNRYPTLYPADNNANHIGDRQPVNRVIITDTTKYMSHKPLPAPCSVYAFPMRQKEAWLTSLFCFPRLASMLASCSWLFRRAVCAPATMRRSQTLIESGRGTVPPGWSAIDRYYIT